MMTGNTYQKFSPVSSTVPFMMGPMKSPENKIMDCVTKKNNALLYGKMEED